LAIHHQSVKAMLISVVILSIAVPIQISMTSPKFEPYIVKATIDTAVLMGFPASRAARKYALQAQKPDFFMTEMAIPTKPIEWRLLYFKKLFS